MTEPLVVETAYDTLGDYDGVEVGFLAVDGTHVPAASMEFVSDVVAEEIDTGDAANYARTTAELEINLAGGEATLRYATGEQAVFDLDGAPSVGGFWLYDTTGGSDAARALICFAPQAVGAGLASHPVNAPDGFASVKAEPVDHEARITSLEGRTIPDATDGTAGQVYTTDGAVGSWEDPVEVLDEDDMASDSDEAVPSQQSVRAYVDNHGQTHVEAAITIIPDEIDGTGNSFTVVQYLPGVAASGVAPEHYSIAATVDAATLAGALTSLYSGAARVLVPVGEHIGVYDITAAGVSGGDPWTPVTHDWVTATVIGNDYPHFVGRLDSDGSYINTVSPSPYYSTGIIAGNVSVPGALDGLEGAMDRHIMVQAVADSDVDTGDFENATWTYGDLIFTDGSAANVDYCHVWLRNQSTPSENGIYEVARTTFTGTQLADPDVFDPAGNFARRMLSLVGDPHDGMTWVYQDDDPVRRSRVGTGSPASDEGRWTLVYDPTTDAANTNATATGAVTVDLREGPAHTLTLTGNVTLTISNPAASGTLQRLTLVLTQDGTGSRTVTWPGSVTWPGGSAPTLTTAASSVDVVEMFTTDGGSTWHATSSLNHS